MSSAFSTEFSDGSIGIAGESFMSSIAAGLQTHLAGMVRIMETGSNIVLSCGYNYKSVHLLELFLLSQCFSFFIQGGREGGEEGETAGGWEGGGWVEGREGRERKR